MFVNQLFGFNQYGQYSVSGTNTATLLDILGTGGTIANRFDNSAVSYNRQEMSPPGCRSRSRPATRTTRCTGSSF